MRELHGTQLYRSSGLLSNRPAQVYRFSYLRPPTPAIPHPTKVIVEAWEIEQPKYHFVLQVSHLDSDLRARAETTQIRNSIVLIPN
jgi:hypothetical protein